MKWIQNIGLTLVITSLLFIKISERQGLTSITLNSVYAIEHMQVNCDKACQEEIDRQTQLWRDYQTLYDKHFGSGAFAGIDLNYVNTTLLRAQIEGKCIQNSENDLVNCEHDLTNIHATTADLCSALATFLVLPQAVWAGVSLCVLKGSFEIDKIPEVCAEMRSNGEQACYAINNY